MDPEIRKKIEETVLDVLRKANLQEMTEFKVRLVASARLGIELSAKEYKSFVTDLVEKFLLSTVEADLNVGEETKEVVREEEEEHEDKERVICELSNKRSVIVQDFKGTRLLSIRDFFIKDGKRLPSVTGISMPAFQWSTFKKSVPAIEEAIKKMESKLRSNLDGKRSEEVSNPETNPLPSEPVPVDIGRPIEIDRLDGKNYQCWAQQMELFLKQLKIAYVLYEPCRRIMLGPEASNEEITRAKAAEQKWMNDDLMCRRNILNSLSDHLFCLYSKKPTTAKELWEELKLVNLCEEFRTKRSQVKKYIEFQMVEEKPVLEQVEEFNNIADIIVAGGILIEEKFHVSVIISKLPPSWKDICVKLMCEEHLPFAMLMQRLKVEQELRSQDKQGVPNYPVGNNLTGKVIPRMRDVQLQGFHCKKRDVERDNRIVCYNCGKKGHSSRQCYSKKKVEKVITEKRNEDNGSTPAVTEEIVIDGSSK